MNKIKIPEHLKKRYAKAKSIALGHYENFPVVSLFIKKDLIYHVAIIYEFARTADDIVDSNAINRMEKLRHFRKLTINSFKNVYESDFWECLNFTVSKFNLNAENLLNLLDAFEQDINVSRYNTHAEILSYCSNSANPVGRIILELNGLANKKTFKHSDEICTALQLTNFLQDIKEDANLNRIYLPQEELEKYGISVENILESKFDNSISSLLLAQVVKVRNLFLEGKKLLRYLPFSLRIQISATILGGTKILNKIEKQNGNVFDNKIKLTTTNFLQIFIIAIFEALCTRQVNK